MKLQTNLGLIISNSLMGGVYFCVIMPLGGLLMAAREVPVWQIGLLGAIPWATTLCATLSMPLLLQRFNARHLYLLARWFGFTAAVIFAMTSNLWFWALAYMLLGLSGGMAWVIGDALLATLPPPEQRAKVMGLYMFLVNFNIIVGPLLVGVMGTGHVTFVLGALILLVNLVLGYIVQFPPRAAATEESHGGLALLLNVAVPVLGLLLVGLAGGSFEGSAIKMLPVQAYGLGYSENVAALAAVASGAGNLISQLLLMRLLKRFTAHQLVIPGLLCLALASLLIVPFAGHIVSYFSTLFVAGGIAGALYTLVVLDLTKNTSTEKGMQRISCIAAFYTIGGVIGPFTAGVLMEESLLWGYSLAMVAITLVALVVYLRLPASKAA